MPRTKGAKNVIVFEARDSVATTASAQIGHLSKAIGATPLEQFRASLSHQNSYLHWIDVRHFELQTAKRKLATTARGPKDATYQKYRWYAEQQTLFEAVNSFEVFYKKTFINLADALRLYIPADRIKGTIEAKIAWSIQGEVSVPALIFEHQLYHDLDQVDKVSSMLVDARRYNIGSPTKLMKPKVKALQAIFQIRHTLAHNQGLVTVSDGAKFGILGYSATPNEVIDPTKEHLGESVRRFLRQEAADFTTWLLTATAAYLRTCSNGGTQLTAATLKRIEDNIGSTSNLKALPWT